MEEIVIYLISALDICYVLLLIASYLTEVFQYMNKFYFSVFKIVFVYQENNLTAKVPGFYKEFYDFFCNTRSNLEFEEVCKRYDQFHNAAAVYLSITLVCVFLVFFGFCNFMGESLEWNRTWFRKLWICHYIYPISHTLSVLLYLWISECYSLTPPQGFSNSFTVRAQAGLFLMFFSEVVSISSLFLYLFSSKALETPEVDLPAEDNYQKIRDFPYKTLPVLPVTDSFASHSSESPPSPSSLESSEVF